MAEKTCSGDGSGCTWQQVLQVRRHILIWVCRNAMEGQDLGAANAWRQGSTISAPPHIEQACLEGH